MEVFLIRLPDALLYPFCSQLGTLGTSSWELWGSSWRPLGASWGPRAVFIDLLPLNDFSYILVQVLDVFWMVFV